MKKQEKTSNTSKVLGILSICLFWIPFIGMALGIVGLCLKKQNPNRDKALNIVGISLGVLMTLYYIGGGYA